MQPRGSGGCGAVWFVPEDIAKWLYHARRYEFLRIDYSFESSVQLLKRNIEARDVND